MFETALLADDGVLKNNVPALNLKTPLSLYISKINSIPMLSEAEEVSLINLYIHNGDKSAGNKIILAHLKIVVKIAQKFNGYKIPLFDLISEGSLGLIRALEKFDPKKGVRFATYAIWWIKSSIQSYVMSNFSSIKLGTSAAHRSSFFNQSIEKKDALAINFQNISQDKEFDENENYNSSFFENDMIECIEKSSNSEKLSSALQKLSARERKIIYMRNFQENRSTLEDISCQIGVSKERIRQIYDLAIKKLRHFMV